MGFFFGQELPGSWANPKSKWNKKDEEHHVRRGAYFKKYLFCVYTVKGWTGAFAQFFSTTYLSCHRLWWLKTEKLPNLEYGGLTLYFLSWYTSGLWWGCITAHPGRRVEQRCYCGSRLGSCQTLGAWIPPTVNKPRIDVPSIQDYDRLP